MLFHINCGRHFSEGISPSSYVACMPDLDLSIEMEEFYISANDAHTGAAEMPTLTQTRGPGLGTTGHSGGLVLTATARIVPDKIPSLIVVINSLMRIPK